MPLFNVFSNRLNDFTNISNKKDVISRRQIKNATSPQLPDTKKNKVVNNSQMQKGILRKHKVAGYSKIEKRATEKNRVAGHFERKKRIEDVNGNMFKFSFFD